MFVRWKMSSADVHLASFAACAAPTPRRRCEPPRGPRSGGPASRTRGDNQTQPKAGARGNLRSSRSPRAAIPPASSRPDHAPGARPVAAWGDHLAGDQRVRLENACGAEVVHLPAAVAGAAQLDRHIGGGDATVGQPPACPGPADRDPAFATQRIGVAGAEVDHVRRTLEQKCSGCCARPKARPDRPGLRGLPLSTSAFACISSTCSRRWLARVPASVHRPPAPPMV